MIGLSRDINGKNMALERNGNKPEIKGKIRHGSFGLQLPLMDFREGSKDSLNN